jgi:outer membrane protein assembly factor BamC
MIKRRLVNKGSAISQLLRLFKIAFCCLLLAVYWGCGTTSEYKKSTATQPLEIPPDLIGSTQFDEQMVIADDGATRFSDYRGQAIEQTQKEKGKEKGNVLPQLERVQIKHDGNIRWLVLQGEPDIFWSKIKQF